MKEFFLSINNSCYYRLVANYSRKRGVPSEDMSEQVESTLLDFPDVVAQMYSTSGLRWHQIKDSFCLRQRLTLCKTHLGSVTPFAARATSTTRHKIEVMFKGPK
jgi:hypothetical protein